MDCSATEMCTMLHTVHQEWPNTRYNRCHNHHHWSRQINYIHWSTLCDARFLPPMQFAFLFVCVYVYMWLLYYKCHSPSLSLSCFFGCFPWRNVHFIRLQSQLLIFLSIVYSFFVLFTFISGALQYVFSFNFFSHTNYSGYYGPTDFDRYLNFCNLLCHFANKTRNKMGLHASLSRSRETYENCYVSCASMVSSRCLTTIFQSMHREIRYCDIQCSREKNLYFPVSTTFYLFLSMST